MSGASENTRPSAPTDPADPPVVPPAPATLTLIRPAALGLSARELWAYRDLLYFLTWRDLKIRYKQTVLGAAWAVLQPVLTMVVFSLFFGRLAKVPSDGLPYPIFSYAALVPWTYFAAALASGGNSLVGNQHVISRIYFPRVLIPLSALLTPLVDACIAFGVLIAMMAGYALVPTVNLLWLPAFVLLAVVTASGAALWFSALNVKYRDVRYVLPFFIQLWLFASPVAYPASMVPEQWRTLYGLNPMVGVIEGFRWALLGSGTGPDPMIAVSCAVALLVFLSGLVFFQRQEGAFADVV